MIEKRIFAENMELVDVLNVFITERYEVDVFNLTLKKGKPHAEVIMRFRNEYSVLKTIYYNIKDNSDFTDFEYSNNEYYEERLVFWVKLEGDIEVLKTPGTSENIALSAVKEEVIKIKDSLENSPIIGKTYQDIPEHEKKHLYTGDDSISYKEVLKYGFPTYQYAKRAFYKHKGVSNWQIEELEIPSYLEKQGQTGKFFKTGLNALPTGENIVVIDLDTLEGKPVGAKNFSDWLEENKINKKDFNTFSVETTSGGIHLYYSYPDGYVVRSKASEFLPEVDTRSEGGIIMMPGSKAKNSEGKVGEYFIKPGSVSYIKPIPQKLLEAICEKPKDFVSKVFDTTYTSELPDEFLRKKEEELINGLRSATKRNQAVYNFSLQAGSLGLPYEETLDKFITNTTLPENEVRSSFASGYNNGQQSPTVLKEKNKVVGDTKMVEKIEQEFNEKYNIQLKWYSVEDLKFFWHDAVKSLDVRYIMEEHKFIQYDPKRGVWARVQKNTIKDMLYEIQYGIKKYFDAIEEVDKEKDFTQQKSFIAPKRFVEDGMDLLASKNSIALAELDQHPDEMVVKNGILSLKDGSVRPFAKEELHTKASAYKYLSKEEYDNYDKGKKARFKKILSVLDPDTLKYVQTVFGGAMTGHQSETQKSFWFYSKGQSGKTTLLNLFGEAILAWTGAPNGSMFAVDASRFIDADGVGKRLWILEEAPSGYLDANKLKKYVGTRFAQIEKKGVDSFREEGVWTMFFAVNNYPLLRKTENNHGTTRRIVMVPFLRRITKDDPSYDASMDKAYKEIEMCELFLHWVVEGAKEWYSNKMAEDNYSLEMLKINNDFQNRSNSDSDPMHDYFKENIVITENTCVTLDGLFSDYQEYCFNSNIKSRKTKLQFKREFEEKTGKIFEKKRPGKYEIVSSQWVRGIDDNKGCLKQKMFGIGYANMSHDENYV